MRRLNESAAAWAAVSIALFPVLVLQRVLEYVLMRQAYVLPPGSVAALFSGLRADLAFDGALAFALAIPVLAVAQARPVLATRLHRALLVVATILSVMLVQYFATTFVPLGADLFGYSLGELTHVTLTSRGVGFGLVVPWIVFGALTWVVTGFAARWQPSGRQTSVFVGLCVLAVIVPQDMVLKASSFSGDGTFFLAQNKTMYFARQTSKMLFRSTATTTADGAPLTGYPLLHAATYDDVLGPRFNTGAQKPNIVFIVVEGLGRDFVGAGAAYGGFTPFLDSLSTRSLYWENFVSTTGRTFGVLSSLLGSLPHAEGGFLELGAQMPSHITLGSLLHDRGYLTSFFTGTAGNFDKIDVFMARQRVDSFIDQSKFGAGYEQQPGEKGFSWGYGDRELFRRGLASYASAPARSRLDVYLTITSHEPFIPPSTAKYTAEFERRLAALPVDEARRAEYRTYASVFSTLLYTDDAIRYFLAEYAKRPDFASTIFIISGDHRLIPVPPGTRADRYRVPFIIWSPMLKAPQRFSSVSSHLDVTPSLVALLHQKYGIAFPDTVPWLGTGIDTATGFRNTHSLALMRVKNQIDEYLDGLTFLSGDELFTVGEGFTLTASRDGRALDAVRAKLERSKALGRFVTSGDHLYPASAADLAARKEASAIDSAFATLHLEGKNPEELYAIARAKALGKEYDAARIVARKLLRDSPNYHDARALYARTYSWNRQFDEARAILTDLVKRAPEYSDGHSALIDVEIWSGHGDAALALVDAALKRFPGDKDFLAQRARALDLKARAARGG